jgi:serine/threonine-protein kinase
MGVVYRARHLRLNRLVALKVVLDRDHAPPQDLIRFLGEAEVLARCQHPHNVPVYEAGWHDGRPYLAMELVGGGTLAQAGAGAPPSARRAAAVMEAVARAVHHAHQRGIVHRDLKPSNVLLGEDGSPKVTDFGLAKRLDGGPGLTETGVLLGTPGYMAPEQALCKAQEVGPRTDVYALGAILYELLTGRPPFKADSLLGTLEQVVSDPPAVPARLRPGVPRDLETICLKCLAKEPAGRYASAEALADDLRCFLKGEPIAARPAPAWVRALRWLRRRPALASLGALPAVAAGALLCRPEGVTLGAVLVAAGALGHALCCEGRRKPLATDEHR